MFGVQLTLVFIFNYLSISVVTEMSLYGFRNSCIPTFPAFLTYSSPLQSPLRVLKLSSYKTDEASSSWKSELESNLIKVTEKFREKLNSFQTDHISTQALECLKIPYFGADIPLKNIASIHHVDRNTVEIFPRDLNLLPSIRKSIVQSNRWQLSDRDPKSILVSIPPLSDETRNSLKREVKNTLESYKIQMRNLKRNTQDELRRNQKEKEISKDDMKKALTQLQKMLDTHIKILDNTCTKKIDLILQDK